MFWNASVLTRNLLGHPWLSKQIVADLKYLLAIFQVTATPYLKLNKRSSIGFADVTIPGCGLLDGLRIFKKCISKILCNEIAWSWAFALV